MSKILEKIIKEAYEEKPIPSEHLGVFTKMSRSIRHSVSSQPTTGEINHFKNLKQHRYDIIRIIKKKFEDFGKDKAKIFKDPEDLSKEIEKHKNENTNDVYYEVSKNGLPKLLGNFIDSKPWSESTDYDIGRGDRSEFKSSSFNNKVYTFSEKKEYKASFYDEKKEYKASFYDEKEYYAFPENTEYGNTSEKTGGKKKRKTKKSKKSKKNKSRK